LRLPSALAGKMRLLDLCKPTCTTSTRGLRPISSRARGVKWRLTALLPLRSAGLAALAEARVARRSVPCSASGASSGTPPGTGFSAVREASGSASDALCRARCRPSLRTTFPGSQDRRFRSSRQRGRRISIQRAFPPPKGPVHTRSRRRFRCRSPASCNRYDSRARPRGSHRTLSRTREVALTRRGVAAALLRAPPAGASRSRGPVAALAASASSRRCPEELPRNRSLPSTPLHEPVPRSGWRSRPRAASPPRERAHPRPRSREIRAVTPRTACAGAPTRGFGPVRIT